MKTGKETLKEDSYKDDLHSRALYRTLCPVRTSVKFSKSGMSRNRRTFNTFRYRKNLLFFFKLFFQILFFFRFYFFFYYFLYLFCLEDFDTNFVSRDLLMLKKNDNMYLLGKMFKNISPYSVWSVRTCPANLGFPVLSG